MLSYIMLVTNDCYHIITLAFLLPHFTKFVYKIPAATRGVSPSSFYWVDDFDMALLVVFFILEITTVITFAPNLSY
jgi:hypothetical protein